MLRSDRLRAALFTYGVQPRGGVVHALSLAEALPSAGVDATLFALDDTHAGLFRAARCPVVLVPIERPPPGDVLASVRARIGAYVEALDAMGEPLRAFDVHHAFDGIGGNALATLAERGTIDGFVRTVHHLDDFAQPELAALQDRSIRSATLRLTGSPTWRERIAARYGVDAELAPSGVDLERFTPASTARRAALRERLGVSTGPLFLSIGGVEPRKNAIGILEAFARVRAARPGARLAIAGGASVLDHGAYRRAF
ncbi:MAG: MSMEG_0565 family glycosyltransferase, partial [Candidatus Eremiobacteraeota bacterium]|nr:MSMEG_0565 family glycosyltransferase [Candidatus Eremiobacteraeota bacterium]